MVYCLGWRLPVISYLHIQLILTLEQETVVSTLFCSCKLMCYDFSNAVNSRQKARCSMPDSYSFSILC